MILTTQFQESPEPVVRIPAVRSTSRATVPYLAMNDLGVRTWTVTRPLPKPLIVVKLGGTALTDKKQICTPRVKEIRRAAKQADGNSEAVSAFGQALIAAL